MKKIYSLIRWTVSCFEVWFKNLGNIWTSDDLYWSCTQTFFQNEVERIAYRQAEKEMVCDLSIPPVEKLSAKKLSRK